MIAGASEYIDKDSGSKSNPTGSTGTEKIFTLADIPEKYKNPKGRHKGKLNQGVLQRKGEFVFRDPHPDVEGLYFLAFNKAQKFPQRWAPESAMPKALGVKPPEGVPEEFVITCNRGRQGAKIGNLDQDALQTEGEFQMGEAHPQCEIILFHSIRRSGRQRWMTEESWEATKKRSAKNQANWRKRNPKLSKERRKEQYEKFWSDPEKAEAERAKRREKRANMTEEEREAERAYNRQKAKENPERKKASWRRDYNKNRERYIAKSALWNKENRKRRNERNRRRHIERFNEEPEYRIVINLRARLRRSVNDHGRTMAVRELCGCTRGELKKWLESKWQKGMSWENYGVDGWHIDHIIPVKFWKGKMQTEQAQKECFHFTNLQPLWAEENLRKSAKLDLN